MTKSNPVYLKLAEQLKKELLETLETGERLPAERTIAKTYHLNRMTVRRALALLQQEGMITARRGSGNYLQKKISDKVPLGDHEQMSLRDQIRLSGKSSDTKTLALHKVDIPEDMKEIFVHDDKIWQIIRLTYVDAHPCAVQIVSIPCSLFPDANHFDFETFSLYDFMENCGHRPRTMTSYLRIEELPGQYQHVLSLKGKKVFRFDYFSYDQNHIPVEHTVSFHDPVYTKFTYTTKDKRYL